MKAGGCFATCPECLGTGYRFVHRDICVYVDDCKVCFKELAPLGTIALPVEPALLERFPELLTDFTNDEVAA